MERIGILGGTFDPVHLGHLIPAQYACNFLGLDRLILIPSARPVHRPRHNPASAEHRLAMCCLAAAALPGFEVSDVETSRAEPSYTALTLAALRGRLGPAARLVLLVGEDNLPLLHTWWHAREVFTLATVAVMPRLARASADLDPLRAMLGDREVDALLGRRVPGPVIPISATEVRNRVLSGLSVAGLVPASVERYIRQTSLYSPNGPQPPDPAMSP